MTGKQREREGEGRGRQGENSENDFPQKAVYPLLSQWVSCLFHYFDTLTPRMNKLESNEITDQKLTKKSQTEEASWQSRYPDYYLTCGQSLTCSLYSCSFS